METPLDPIEVRILGSLLEKEASTPEYYPLTLNALINACNQRSNRDPVVSYDQETVERALESLRRKKLVLMHVGVGIRAPKYSQKLRESLNLERREAALLCELMIRGPQTPGELRSRSERMHGFTALEEVEASLERLMKTEPQPLVTRLPRQPGTKESRYGHLLSGPVETTTEPAAPARVPATEGTSALRDEVAELRERLTELERQFSDFRKQFE